MKSLWMLSAAFFFSLMAVFVKFAGADFGSFELIFYRSLAGVALMYAFVRFKDFSLKTPYPWSHVKRSCIGTLSMALWFFSLTMMPIGTSMTLNYTSPLFMALFVLIYSLYRKEPVPWALLGTIVLGFCGVVLIFQPSLDSGSHLGATLALSSGLLGAVAYWQIRELSKMDEPSWRIVFYFTVFGTVFGLVGCLLFEGGLSPISAENIKYLAAMALCATLAQCSLTFAFGHGNLLLSSCLQFSAIVMAETMGVIFFGDAVTPTTVCGIGIIVVAGVSASLLTRNKK